MDFLSSRRSTPRSLSPGNMTGAVGGESTTNDTRNTNVKTTTPPGRQISRKKLPKVIQVKPYVPVKTINTIDETGKLQSLQESFTRGIFGRTPTPTPKSSKQSRGFLGNGFGLFRSHSLDKMENIDERTKKNKNDENNYDYISRRRSLGSADESDQVFKIMKHTTETLPSIGIKQKLPEGTKLFNHQKSKSNTWAWSND